MDVRKPLLKKKDTEKVGEFTFESFKTKSDLDTASRLDTRKTVGFVEEGDGTRKKTGAKQ